MLFNNPIFTQPPVRVASVCLNPPGTFRMFNITGESVMLSKWRSKSLNILNYSQDLSFNLQKIIIISGGFFTTAAALLLLKSSVMSEGTGDYVNAITIGDPVCTNITKEEWQDLRKWQILKDVPEILLRQVRYAIVARRYYDSWCNFSLMITHDDQAYVIGDNRFGQLGVHKTQKYVESATKVEKLTGLGIIGFSASWRNVSLWTKDGKLFITGDNAFGLFGPKRAKELDFPQKAFLMETNAKVVKVVCALHILCLTADSEVYAWGSNKHRQCTPESVSSVTTPTKIKFPVDEIKIVDVACTLHSSFALFADGQLYGWGGNDKGNLGIGSSEKFAIIPTKIVMPNGARIKQVACGYDHCMVLSTEGTLLVWGSNESGQLGTGNKDAAHSPMQINIKDVVSISAVNGMYNSVCQTHDGSVFAWGSFIDSNEPQRTVFENINDCRCHYELGMSEIWVSNFGVKVAELECFAFLLNHVDKKKVTFHLDDNTITASKVYLYRCNVFAEKLKGEWKQELKTHGLIKMTDIKSKPFKIFIEFLQTDRIENYAGDDLLDLLELAHVYKMERFRSAVTDLITKKEMTAANAIKFYIAALKFKDNTLHWEAINFIKPHALQILNKLNFATMEQSIVVNLLADIQALGAFGMK